MLAAAEDRFTVLWARRHGAELLVDTAPCATRAQGLHEGRVPAFDGASPPNPFIGFAISFFFYCRVLAKSTLLSISSAIMMGPAETGVAFGSEVPIGASVFFFFSFW